MNTETETCNEASPIYKGDTGPVRCTLPKGHEGNHQADLWSYPETRLYARSWKPYRFDLGETQNERAIPDV